MSSIEARDLSLTLGSNRVLRGVSLDLRPGEMLGLIGPNGAGKTCLLRILAGILSPSQGWVRIDGRPLQSLPAQARSRRIAYLTQAGTAHWPVSVERIVALGRLPHLGNWQLPGNVTLP